MRIVMSCLLVCATACAPSSVPPVAASSLQVDPLAEVVPIPPGACLGLDDHFAMSTNAVRSLLVNMAETQTRHAVELAKCSGAARLAEQRQKQAEDAADRSAWLARWGLPLGFAAGAAVATLVGAVLLSLGGR
jgi:hypothetical protein